MTAVAEDNYSNLSATIEYIKLYLLTIFPINSLIKSIYNRIAEYLFENSDSS